MNIDFLTYEALPTRRAATTRKVGGLNTIVYHLSKSLAALSGNNVTISCCGKDDNEAMAELPPNTKVIQIASKSPSLSLSNSEESCQTYAHILKQQYSESPPDIVYTSGSEAGYVMYLAKAHGLRIPWIHTNYATLAVRRVNVMGMTTTDALSDPVTQRELSVLNHCDHIIALSEIDKTEICEVFDITREKITVVHPGVDHSIFTPGELHNRESLVISAGRMSKIKDFPFLLRSFQLVTKFLLSTTMMPKLVIIGGDKQERDDLGLPQLVESLSLKHCISFYDGMKQSDLARYFQRARVFVGCSQHETFGLLPIEARACGTPWVVRANSSYLSSATNGYGGFFVDNVHEQDMAKKISDLLSLSDRQWEKMSKAAIESASQYTWPKAAQNCMTVFVNVSKLSL
jgi:D-inositol-3-phosphate glycosyltransferase